MIPSVPRQPELTAILIVREALLNVRMDAQATHTTIGVVAEDDNLTTPPEDDDKGFEVDIDGNGDARELGLCNMKEGADSIHSSLCIESRLERGTDVTLRIP